MNRERNQRSLHLPVLTRRTQVKAPRVAHIRAVALIAVQLLMVVHVLCWAMTGKSIGRFVLSDSMKTLELGEINPGFLLFAGSLVLTALFGRLMCGWICHMGALQDFASWLLRRTGIQPRLFRSRFLGYIPLVLAGYMFVWPTLKREVVCNWIVKAWPEWASSLQVAKFPGMSLDITTDRLWDELPPWWIAIPFLLICGFGTVYFLGARGLCRYACPYGGFLLPVEQLAVGRVVADMSKCDQCGICTSTCTAGVRVHDDIRHYRAVVDRNCVRSFDCVEACPSGALRFGLTTPAVGRHATALSSNERARQRIAWTAPQWSNAIHTNAIVSMNARPIRVNAPFSRSCPGPRRTFKSIVRRIAFQVRNDTSTPSVAASSIGTMS